MKLEKFIEDKKNICLDTNNFKGGANDCPGTVCEWFATTDYIIVVRDDGGHKDWNDEGTC